MRARAPPASRTRLATVVENLLSHVQTKLAETSVSDAVATVEVELKDPCAPKSPYREPCRQARYCRLSTLSTPGLGLVWLIV